MTVHCPSPHFIRVSKPGIPSVKKAVVLSFIFLVHCTHTHSQETFPVITDYPSLKGSFSATALYALSQNNERLLAKQATLFHTEYGQRILYLDSPLTWRITSEINTELYQTMTRYETLEQRNNSLGIFARVQKNKNKKMLKIIKRLIVILNSELSKQHSAHVLLGEKMNLYQNAMASITKIQRQLDGIEDKIDRASLLNQILGKY